MSEKDIFVTIIDQQKEIIRLLKNPMAQRYMTRLDISSWSPFLRSKLDFQEAEKEGLLTPIGERPKYYLKEQVEQFHNLKEKTIKHGDTTISASSNRGNLASERDSILATLEG